jgi:glycosyltransferase involved in cell wall biosynthesis
MEFLDVLPDLTRRFEILIVDDCSQDATIEVADELCGHYPQVRVTRHSVSRGRVAAIATGIERSTGEMLLLADEDCGLALDELGRLWQALEDHPLVLARPAPMASTEWIAPIPSRPGGLVMGHRESLQPLAGALKDRISLRAHLIRCGRTWHEVEIAERIPHVGLHRAAVRARRILGLTRVDSRCPGELPAPVSRPKTPNYLHHSSISEKAFLE